MDFSHISLSLASPENSTLNAKQKMALALAVCGFFVLLLALFNFHFPYKNASIFASFTSILLGITWFSYENYQANANQKLQGVYHKNLTNKGISAWILAVLLTLFYIMLYWFPSYLGFDETGKNNTSIIGFFDDFSLLLNGKPATQWFVYGVLYTLATLSFGVRFLIKFRHNRYHVVRTISIMFFQLIFAFLIPEILSLLNPALPYFAKDFKNMWPLNYYFFEDWHLKNMLQGGALGTFALIFGICMTIVISPILTYFFGKRWYCSWVCGCGGLAETAGDSFRHLSSKKHSVWQLERWLIHSILAFIIVTTIAVLYSFLLENPHLAFLSAMQFISFVSVLILLFLAWVFIYKPKQLAADAQRAILIVGTNILLLLWISILVNPQRAFFINSYQLRQWYGFFIGAIFSGVIGVGFYPLLGSRVWCRFGCPMAAVLGFQQKLFSKFRITTNGGQCISCGNCSTYCEMGIDVRAYAQEGIDIVRSSCVGCGLCAEVCPRGVLKLENLPLTKKPTT